MHITILTIGSRGDVQPFIALALGLKHAGHTVRLATHANYETFIHSLGLDFALLSFNPQEAVQKQAGQAMLQGGKNPIAFTRNFGQMLEPYYAGLLTEAWEACQGTDIIIAVSQMFAALDFAEKLRIPLYYVGLQPIIPTSAFPVCAVPPELERMGGIFNRFSYSLV